MTRAGATRQAHAQTAQPCANQQNSNSQAANTCLGGRAGGLDHAPVPPRPASPKALIAARENTGPAARPRASFTAWFAGARETVPGPHAGQARYVSARRGPEHQREMPGSGIPVTVWPRPPTPAAGPEPGPPCPSGSVGRPARTPGRSSPGSPARDLVVIPCAVTADVMATAVAAGALGLALYQAAFDRIAADLGQRPACAGTAQVRPGSPAGAR
jgi:hypothetical protein